jgi:hypothetical protein
MARRGQRGIAVPGGHVQHALPGAEVYGLTKVFADNLQRPANNGVIAGRLGSLLLGFDR